MGWSFSTTNTKQEEIAGIFDGFRDDCTVRKHTLRSNNLWVLLDTPDGPVIVLAMLQSGYPDMGYGHKILDESAGPTQVDCPVSWLDIVPVPTGKHAGPWRERVRAYHAAKHAKRQMAPGQVWRIHAGYKTAGDRCELVAKRPCGWLALIDGQHYRVMPRMLAERIG